MEDLLVDQDYWIIMGGAKSTIDLSLSDSVLLNVSGEAIAKEIWDKLYYLY
jgi:hypothetical protein